MKKHQLGLSDDQMFDNLGRCNNFSYDLMRTIDIDNNNYIDLVEFINRFLFFFKQVKVRCFKLKCVTFKAEKEDEWVGVAVKDIGEFVNTKYEETVQAFRKITENQDRGLSYQEFEKFLQLPPFNYSQQQSLHLAKYVDSSGSGTITLNEFQNAFQIVDTGSKDWQVSSLQQEG
jgi:Ca2+-binding EF-hand superfamily protein